jgi:TRAP-type C4-dicarboxylate transport system permease small subunit
MRRAAFAITGLVDRRLPPGGRRAMRLATDALGIAVVGVVLASAPTIFATQAGVIDFVGLPRYSLSVPLLASCVLIAGDFPMDALHTLLGQEPPHMSEEAALFLL